MFGSATIRLGIGPHSSYVLHLSESVRFLFWCVLFTAITPNCLNCILGKCSAVDDMGDRLASIDMGQKVGSCAPFRGIWVPHLTQCHLDRGLPVPLPSCILLHQPFGHNRHGPKIGGCAPLGRGAGSLSNTMWPGAKAYLCAKFHLDPSNRLATIYQRYRQTGQTNRQRSHSIGRSVLQTVVQKFVWYIKCSTLIDVS